MAVHRVIAAFNRVRRIAASYRAVGITTSPRYSGCPHPAVRQLTVCESASWRYVKRALPLKGCKHGNSRPRRAARFQPKGAQRLGNARPQRDLENDHPQRRLKLGKRHTRRGRRHPDVARQAPLRSRKRRGSSYLRPATHPHIRRAGPQGCAGGRAGPRGRRFPRGQFHRRGRRIGVGQVHAAALHGGPRRTHSGYGDHARHRHFRYETGQTRAIPRQAHGFRLPGIQPHRLADRRGKRLDAGQTRREPPVEEGHSRGPRGSRPGAPRRPQAPPAFRRGTPACGHRPRDGQPPADRFRRRTHGRARPRLDRRRPGLASSARLAGNHRGHGHARRRSRSPGGLRRGHERRRGRAAATPSGSPTSSTPPVRAEGRERCRP